MQSLQLALQRSRYSLRPGKKREAVFCSEPPAIKSQQHWLDQTPEAGLEIVLPAG